MIESGVVVSTTMPDSIRRVNLRRNCRVAGFEPVADFDATADGDCTCDFCQGWCAAKALQDGGSNRLDATSFDADLQRVVSIWGGLPDAIRRAVFALIGAGSISVSFPTFTVKSGRCSLPVVTEKHC